MRRVLLPPPIIGQPPLLVAYRRQFGERVHPTREVTEARTHVPRPHLARPVVTPIALKPVRRTQVVYCRQPDVRTRLSYRTISLLPHGPPR